MFIFDNGGICPRFGFDKDNYISIQCIFSLLVESVSVRAKMMLECNVVIRKMGHL